MKITDIIEGKSENRELWDRIKSKGVVPGIDRERYTDMSDQGLEGPFRMKNGQVLYYDPKEGKYYNRDTDMYVDYDDYRAMNEKQLAELGGDQHYGDATGAWDKGSKATPITPKKATKDALKTLNKVFKNTKKPEQGVAEGDKRPSYVVKASDKTKKVKPNTGGSSAHPYQGKLVGEAEVSNTDYQWAHGKKPGGQGSWFFVAHRGGINFSKDVEGEDYIQLHQMSYGDAKKAAIKWAKSKGHTSLFVAT